MCLKIPLFRLSIYFLYTDSKSIIIETSYNDQVILIRPNYVIIGYKNKISPTPKKSDIYSKTKRFGCQVRGEATLNLILCS